MSALIPDNNRVLQDDASAISDKISKNNARADTGSTINKPVIGKYRFALAILIALLGDACSIVLPISLPSDILTALLLIVILGFHPEIILVIAVEMMPGLEMFPTWLLFIIYLYGRYGRTQSI